MGGLFTSIADYFFSKPEVEFRLSFIGFENAGKSTILQKLKFVDQNIAVNTVPTIGMNMDEVTVNNVKLKVWDLSG